MRAIVFYALCSLNSVGKDGMFPLPAILTLGYFWAHIHPSNCSDVPSNIKALIDKTLSLTPTLNVSNVYPDNGHICYNSKTLGLVNRKNLVLG